mgnify:CR=1 FL=1
MKIVDKIKTAIMRILNMQDLKHLGCDISPYMADAIRIWEDLFYLVDQLPHTLKLAQTITSYMATLATSELTIDGGASSRGKYITNQAQANIMPNIAHAVQLAGTGGMAAIKPYVRGNQIYMDIIPRQRIYATRFGANGRIDAGFFTDFEEINGKTIVKLEQFDLQDDGLYIENHAYRMRDNDFLGTEIPLDSVERWAGLEEETIIANVDRPHFGIIKMPMINNIDGSDYPISIFANAVDSIVQIDKSYEQFIWERDTGKRRMIIDRSAAVVSPINGKPAIPFKKLASDYYMTIDMPENKPWDDYTPELRIEKYRQAIDLQLRMMEIQTGFSPGTFQIDVTGGKVTATQVISEDRTTYNTIKSIQDRGMIPGLIDCLYWFDVYATLYNLAPSGRADISVSCGDSIFEDTAVEFQRRKAMADARYIRPEILTAWYFGVSEEEAKEMLPADTPDSILFGGGA